MSDTPPKAWVPWYHYYDGSGSGVMRAYTDEARAKQDKDLFNDVHDSKEYELSEVPLFSLAPTEA